MAQPLAPEDVEAFSGQVRADLIEQLAQAQQRAAKAEDESKRYGEALRAYARPLAPVQEQEYRTAQVGVSYPEPTVATPPGLWQDSPNTVLGIKPVRSGPLVRAVVTRDAEVLLSTKVAGFEEAMQLVTAYVRMMGFQAGDSLSVVGLENPGWSGQRSIVLGEDTEGRG